MGKINIKIGTQLDNKGFTDIKNEFKDIKKSIEDMDKESLKFNSSLKGVGETASIVSSALEKSYNPNLGNINLQTFNKELKRSGTTLSDVQTAMTSFGSKGITAWNDLASKVLSTNTAVKNTATILENIGDIFTKAFSWNIISQGMNEFANKAKEAVTFTQQLNESLNDIRIVTGASAEEMANFSIEAQKMAKELKTSSTVNVTNASLIYAQQGLEERERNEKARITTEVSNLSKQSADIVSQQLTGVWNGFQIQAEDAEKTVDKLSNVANKTASDLGGLAEALSKTASVANTMGLNIDDAIGAIATIKSVTQDSDSKIGNSIKSILARISDLEVSPTATDEFGVSLGKVSEGLADVGINILDFNGEARALSDVFDEIGGKWKTWNKTQQQTIAQLIGGKYQFNSLMAWFDNWDLYESAREASKNSLGALQEQQDIFAESMKASANEIKVDWEGLYQTILDDDTFIQAYKTIDTLLVAFTKFEQGLGGGSKSIAQFGLTLSSLFSKQIAQGINTAINRVNEFKTTLDQDQIYKDLAGMIDKEKKAMKDSILSEGLSINTIDSTASIAGLQKQKELYGQMYESRKLLTTEERNSLLNIQRAVYELEKEKTSLEVQKKIIDEIESKRQKSINGLDRIQEITLEINSLNDKYSDGELSKSDAIRKEIQLRQQLTKEIKEDSILSKTILSEQLEQGGAELNLKKASEQVEKQILSLYQQEGLSQNDVNKALTQINAGKIEQLKQEEQIRIKQQEQLLAEKQKIATTQRWVQGISLAVSGMISLSNVISVMIDKSSTLDQKINSWGSSITQIGGMLSSAGLSTGNMIMAGIGAGISVLSSVLTPFIGEWAKDQEVSIETLNDEIRETKDLLSKTADDVAGLREVADEYNELAKGVDRYGRNVNLTKESYERYNEIVNQVLGISQDLVLGYDSEGKAIFEKNRLVEREIELLEKKAKMSEDELYTSKNVAAKNKADYGEYEKVQKTLGNTKEKLDRGDQKTEGAIQSLLDQIAVESNRVDSSMREKSQEYQHFLDLYISGKKADLFSFVGTLSAKQVEDFSNSFADESKEEIVSTIGAIQEAYNQFSIDYHSAQERAESSLADSDFVYGMFKRKYEEDYNKILNIEGLQGETILQAYANSLGFDENNKTYEDLAIKLQGFSERITSLFSNNDNREQLNYLLNDFKGSYAEYMQGVKDFVNTNIEDFKNNDGTVNESFINSLFGFDTASFDANTEQITQFSNDVLKEVDNAIKESIQTHGDNGITRELLSNIFSQEELEDVSEILQDLNWSQVKDGSKTVVDALLDVKKAMDFSSEVQKAGEDISKIDSAITSLADGGKLNDKELENVIYLESKYSELAEIRDRGSAEYLQRLREIRDRESDLVSQDLLTEVENLQNKLGSLDVNVNPEEYYRVMNELQDKKIMLDVQFNANTSDLIDSAYGFADVINEIGNVLTKDFQISFDQARYFAQNGFGAILENAKTTGDGLLQLDEDVVFNYVQNRQSELEVSKQAKIKELEQEKIVLNGRKNILVKKLEALKSAVGAETDVEKAKFLAQAVMYQNDYEQYEQQVISKTDVAENGDLEISEDAKRLSQVLGGEAQTQADNQIQSVQDADTAYAQGVSNAISYYAELCQKLQEVAANVKAAATGGTVTNNIQGGSGAKGISATSTAPKQSQNSFEKTDNESIKQEYDAIADTLSKLNQDEVNKVINDTISTTQNQIANIDSQLDQIDLSIKQINNVSTALDKKNKQNRDYFKKYGTTDPTKSQLEEDDPKKKKKKKKSGNKKKKEKKGGSGTGVEDHNYIDYEVDYYHDIERQIEKLKESFEDLERAKDKAYGQKYVDTLKKESSNLQGQLTMERARLSLIKATIKAQRSKLDKTYNVKFNSDGSISDFNKEMKRYQDYYNNKIKTDPDNASDYKDAFDDFKKLMNAYDENFFKKKQEALNAIEEVKQKMYETTLESFTYTVKVKLDTSSLKKDWLSFRLELNDILYDSLTTDNIIQTTRNSINQAKTILAQDGSLKTLSNAINSVISSKTISNADKKDLLTEYSKDLKDAYKNLQTLEKEIKQGYVNAINEADEKFKEHSDRYKQISNELEHTQKVYELVNGEDSLNAIRSVGSAQYENNRANLSFLAKEVQYWGSLSGKFKKGTKEWEAWNDSLVKSQEELNSAIEDSITQLQDLYKEVVSGTIDQLTHDLAGLNFKDLTQISEDWDQISYNAEKYLDTVDRISGIDNYILSIEEKINEISDAGAKQKLLDLQNEELEILTKKDELTKYDLERANARLEVVQKQIALEDSLKSKTSMRLMRGADGNWSYNYAQDKDDISSKQKELNNAQKSLYDLDKNRYSENLKEMYTIYSEWTEKIKALYQNTALTMEEKEIEKEKYARYYGELINNICEENETVRQNYQASTFSVLKEMYDDNEKYTKDMLQKLTGTSYDAWHEVEKDSSKVMWKMNTNFDSAIQRMINVISTNPDSFKSVIKNTYEELDIENDKYMKGLSELENVSGEKFSSINTKISSTRKETESLCNQNDKLISKYDQLQLSLDRLFKNFTTYKDKWKDLKKASINALKAAKEYMEELDKLDNKTPPKERKNTNTKKPAPTTTKTKEGKAKKENQTNNSKIGKGSRVILKTTPYYYTSSGEGGKGTQHKGDKVYITNISSNAKYPYHVSLGSKLGSGDLGWVKKSQISAFKTGGYTGEWGNEGKIGILHEKEQIFNAEDTLRLKNVMDIAKQLYIPMVELSRVKSSMGINKINNINKTQNDMRTEISIAQLDVHSDNVDELTRELSNLKISATQRVKK